MKSPLEQFQVKVLQPFSIGGVDISFTNTALFMGVAVCAFIAVCIIALRRVSVVPSRMQALAEFGFSFITSLADQNLGGNGRKYVPFLITVFFFILFGNLIGLIPYAFTFTAQLIVTFGLSLIVFVLMLCIGFNTHGLGFFSFFFPKDAPMYLFPILLPIEIISFLSRPVSLSIRLFVNMMAGHTMIKVFALFTVSLGVYGISTIALNTVLIGFEVLVSCLQAYVFTILTCLYIKDVIELH